MSDKYEYLVTYRNSKPGVFASRRGRVIKQTKEGADALVKWERARGYDVELRRRTLGPWETL